MLALSVAFAGSLDNAYDVGKAEYEVIRRDARMPVYGDCWKRALSDLEQGCQALTDDKQSRLALSFANCFLAMSGQTTYPCDSAKPVSQCLKSVDGKAFSAFSNFFTHTHNMCQFLQSQVWHEKTEETIESLTLNSAKVATSIANWSDLQTTILNNQVTTLHYQEQIMANGSALNAALESSRQNAKQLMDEFRTSTSEQQALIFSLFDRVAKLQSLVVSEVSWLYSVVFYAGTLILVYVMTATRRTADARFPLLMLFTLNAVVERLICSISLNADADDDILGGGDINSSSSSAFPFPAAENELPDAINFRIWLARKTALLTALVVLAYTVWNFRDYNLINNAILRDIQTQNKELRSALQVLRADATFSTNSSNVTATIPGGDCIDSSSSVAGLPVGDSDEDSDTASTLSFNSTATDRTWMVQYAPTPDSDRDDFSEEEENTFDEDLLDLEFLSAENSANGSIMEMKVMQPPESVVENVSSDNTQQQKLTGTGKKRGRPKGSSNSSRGSTPRRSVTPMQQLNSSHGYNLRNRSGLSSSSNASTLSINNPSFQHESPETFCRRVDAAYKNSIRNHMHLCETLATKGKQSKKD